MYGYDRSKEESSNIQSQFRGSKLQSYNHLFSSYSFRADCEREERLLKERIEVLENAFEKEAKRDKSTTLR